MITSGGTVAPRGQVQLTATGGSGTGFTWAITSTPPRGSIAGSVYTAGAVGDVSDTVRVTDSLGNFTTRGITITKALTLSPTTASVVPGGSATFTGHDGAGGFTYSVEAPAHGTITAGGVYTAGTTGGVTDSVKVTDANGATATAIVTISGGVTLVSNRPTLPPNGTATLTATGGSGSFPIGNWSLATGGSGGTLTPAANGTATFKAGATGGTSDTITVRDSLNNPKSITISIGGGLVITQGTTATAPPRGSRTFTATGGDTSSAYTWSFASTPGSGDATLAAGVYKAGDTGSSTDTIRVTDASGNTAQIVVSVTAGVTVTGVPASLSVAPRAAIQFTANGGSGSGFSWLIAKGSGGDASLDVASGAYRAGSTGNGTDTIRATDSLGNFAVVEVVVGAGLVLAQNVDHVPPRGTAQFTATGGQAPYTFAMQTSASGAAVVSSSGAYIAGATPSVTDVVRVTDANGATATLPIAVDAGITITPATPSVLPSGTIAFAATGGSGSGFTWSVAVNASGGSIGEATGAYVAGTTASKVDQVRVQDSLGNFATVNVSVGGGLAITPAGGSVPPRGSIEFGAFGGTNAGFVWSVTAPSGGSITAAGRYTAGATANVTDKVKVVDSGGHSLEVDVLVTAGLSITPSTTNTSPRGTVTFAASGGSGTGITFAMGVSGSGATITSDGRYTAGATGNTTDTVTATDSLGNTAQATVTVGGGLAVTPTSASVAPGGTTSFTASGGSGGYTFSFPGNLSGGTLSTTGTYVAGHTPNVTDEIRVTDSAGASLDVDITVGAGITITPATPSVAASGTLGFSATGGSAAGYVWSFTTNASGGTIDASTGAYVAGTTAPSADTIKVTDSLGNTASVTVSVGGALVISPTEPTAAPRGTVAFSAIGGTGSYTWGISTNASGGTIDASGRYTAGATGNVTDVVTVTDSAGATATVNVVVSGSLRITPEAASAKPGGRVSFTATGGVGPYTWTLDANASGATLDASTGAYTAGATIGNDILSVTDSLGNTARAAVAVTADGTAPPPSNTADGGASSALPPGLDINTGTNGSGDDGCHATSTASASPSTTSLLFGALALLALRRRRRT